MLEAKNITVTAGKTLLLDDVSVTLAAGQVSVILGPNGAGKSTFLGCLAGLRKPDIGTLWLDNMPAATMGHRARARRIGLLPQNADVHWDLAARDLVALGRFPFRGESSNVQDEEIIDAAMAATQTDEFAARRVMSLSGGERARILLARVLAGQPEYLLADEPLANLDPRFQLQMLGQMRALAKSGTGVVMVLHDLTQAAQIADHIVLMRRGRIFAEGSPSFVLTAKNIQEVYGVAATILHDDNGRLIIIPRA